MTVSVTLNRHKSDVANCNRVAFTPTACSYLKMISHNIVTGLARVGVKHATSLRQDGDNQASSFEYQFIDAMDLISEVSGCLSGARHPAVFYFILFFPPFKLC